MIDRYTRPEMGHIFSLENKYAVWQEIEVLACEAHAEIGESGITREEAYAIVQENAMATWHEVQDCVSGPTFKERLEADPRCTVSDEKLDEIFDPWDFLTRINVVFDRLEQLSFE